MRQISKELDFFLNISKLQAVLSRNFEGRLGGLGYSEFIVLYHLSQAKEEKLRRIDLANKVGLTRFWYYKTSLTNGESWLYKKRD